MQTLSAEEQQRLIEIINDDFGAELTFEAFSDVMHRLFEDIPGFETISPAKADRYVNHLWSQYYNQKRR